MQEFYINKGSVNPILRMELINDGRYDFSKFWNVLQDATITFTMTNVATGVMKVANAPASIRLNENGGCEEEYIICYNWTHRDTRESGIFRGQFNIKFNGDLTQNGVIYPTGNIIVPIREELYIYIRD